MAVKDAPVEDVPLSVTAAASPITKAPPRAPRPPAGTHRRQRSLSISLTCDSDDDSGYTGDVAVAGFRGVTAIPRKGRAGRWRRPASQGGVTSGSESESGHGERRCRMRSLLRESLKKARQLETAAERSQREQKERQEGIRRNLERLQKVRAEIQTSEASESEAERPRVGPPIEPPGIAPPPYDQMMSDIRGWIAQGAGKMFSVGSSALKRTIWAVEFPPRQGAPPSKRNVLIIGGQHSREWQAISIVYRLCERLSAEPLSYTVTVIPMVNPDGYEISRTKRWWRTNHRNVDLNRNYDFNWGVNTGGACRHEKHGNQTYCGRQSFSESESRLVKRLMQGRVFHCVLDIHSYGNLVMWPWTSLKTVDTSPLGKRTVEIGQHIAEGLEFTPKQGSDHRICSGTLVDWVYAIHKVPAYVVEIGSYERRFGVDIEEVIPTRNRMYKALDTLPRNWLDPLPSGPPSPTKATTPTTPNGNCHSAGADCHQAQVFTGTTTGSSSSSRASTPGAPVEVP